MAYTPELSRIHSRTLKRIAWATGKPMTRTLELIFDWLPDRMDEVKVCSHCRDREFCNECPFNKEV
ncbi:hypothetical protein Dthio_PD3621 [Desulfonatronospira thiodismutans ASO3-1]|uniref:Uncharacterized protein n=1 Tax=Desulfonatronospira thiodismutans ASO3-1 TaxID=555779 RepID=D6SJW2_9BACT|nr:hypothetical protein [Desulfonatronospira thiodismutans]EFI36165.1 hypothetical protein Dthio_PD3621 [Desulfonatronospira thiodismutans ASO3-1]